ncbi:MAG: glycosyltransferase [Methanomicrobiaceae archaeon]|nr:glycosyltransferase [Methanomicrobiaceae archaeon]
MIAGIVFAGVALIPYAVYLAGIMVGKKPKKTVLRANLPPISIIMAAYNEEGVIGERLHNILTASYPRDRYEILVVDDCSSDTTAASARDVLDHSGVQYTILANEARSGTNRSYNRAMRSADHEIIVTTDANKFFAPDALSLVVSRLVSNDEIGAVCGDQRPLGGGQDTRVRGMEAEYRNIYGRMCDWESAIDSTYNFNGPLVAFKRSAIPYIEERCGADDANTAFAAIRNGYRAVYETGAVVYERVPKTLQFQYRQKIRRATRLIESTLANLDLLREKRPFSRYFYPLRIFMYLVTPGLFFTGAFLLFVGLFLEHPIVGAMVCVLVAVSLALFRNNLISAFILNQAYLLVGLLHVGRDMRVWESTSILGN